MNKSPCYGCENREIGCHAKCEAYITFRTEQDRINRERYRANDEMSAFIDLFGKRKR